MASILTDVLESAKKAGLAFMTVKQAAARRWMYNEAKKYENVDAQSIMDSEPMNLKNRLVPGYMYMFRYNAKLKEILPYWDRYPLIFPIEVYDDGFLGINFHYLPLEYRAKLMDALYGLAFNNKYDESTRLRISYEILQSSAKYKYFKPCVKRYLYKQLQSQFYLIDWKSWPTALFLPMERFQKATSQAVWSDSVNSISAAIKKKQDEIESRKLKKQAEKFSKDRKKK